MATELEPIERASEDELRALQLERLRWSVRHTYQHVGSWRARCDAAGVHPEDLRTLADLRHFPFTVKHDLRAGYPFGLLAVPREQDQVDAGARDAGAGVRSRNDRALGGQGAARHRPPC